MSICILKANTDIATYEEYNALYYELLFSCIWNGLYNEDLSVIKNLRSSNISDNGIVILEEDNGHTYKLRIPEKLASDLKQLANISVPEARQLMIKPFDKSILGGIEKAIFEANIGITPNNNGEIIILNIPALR